MFLRNFTGALVATSLTACACLSLTSCGQKGELYLPAKDPSKVSIAEHKNAKSNYIFGSHKAPASAPAATVPTASEPAATQSVTGGSAS